MNEAVTLDRASGARVAADPIAKGPLAFTLNGKAPQLHTLNRTGSK